jgi:hypothetical protein
MMARMGRFFAALMMVAMAAILGIASGASCATGAPQFRLIDPELIDDPKFGSCARTGTTLQASQTQFALLTSICVQRMGDAGVLLDPPEPEPAPKDAGAATLAADGVGQ